MNKRQNRRLECSLEAKIDILNKSRSVEITDINEYGARLISSINISPGEDKEIEISAAKGNIYRFKCKIVWSAIFLSKYMLGIVFLDNDLKMIRKLLSDVDLSFVDDSKIANLHKETFDMVFESYTEELFLRQLNEFVEYIKKNDPSKASWSEGLYKDLKESIENILSEFETWANNTKPND